MPQLDTQFRVFDRPVRLPTHSQLKTCRASADLFVTIQNGDEVKRRRDNSIEARRRAARDTQHGRPTPRPRSMVGSIDYRAPDGFARDDSIQRIR